MPTQRIAATRAPTLPPREQDKTNKYRKTNKLLNAEPRRAAMRLCRSHLP